jgi:hypothetical protein
MQHQHTKSAEPSQDVEGQHDYIRYWHKNTTMPMHLKNRRAGQKEQSKASLLAVKIVNTESIEKKCGLEQIAGEATCAYSAKSMIMANRAK